MRPLKELAPTVGTAAVIVLIDMQEFFLCKLLPTDKQALVMACENLLEEAAQIDMPVAALHYEPCGPMLSSLDTLLNAVPRVRRVAKFTDDGFQARKLWHALESFNAGTLVLAGVNASCCVLKTAQSAVRYGYRIVTSRSLIANDVKRLHTSENAYRWYQRKGAIPRKPIDLSCI